MSPLSTGLPFAVVLAAAPLAAQACAIYQPFDPQDVQDADAVVVGRLSGYRLVIDQEGRRAHREMVTRHPGMFDPADGGEPDSLLGDYAVFDLAVDEVLAGRVSRRLRVKWDNSTFGEPAQMPDGSYLIALRRPVLDDGEPGYTVYQRPCSGAFILRLGERDAMAVLRVLAGEEPYPPGPPPPPPPDPAVPRPAPDLPATHRNDPPSLVERIPLAWRVILGGTGLGLLMAAVAVLRRGRPAKDAAPD